MPTDAPVSADLVDVAIEIPSVLLDIRYATANNFTGTALYAAPRCLLRRAIARRLKLVQIDLRAQGLSLKLWDCYRPFSVQEDLWRKVPNPRFVARPVTRNGQPSTGSKHNRGAAVDLTLVTLEGKPIAMPTDFDDFSARAGGTYPGATQEQKRNARRLARAMKRRGFTAISSEWWHFDGPGWRSYPLVNVPLVANQAPAPRR